MKNSVYTHFFDSIRKTDVGLAGGKGASLGEMTQAGISVPPGFVVTAQAFEEFLKATDLNVELDAILDHVDYKVIHTVDDASEKIKALILGAEMPEAIAKEVQQSFKKLNTQYVAVRSSATSEDSADAAWAGQLESYLNTTEDKVLENVKKCWASLFTPRAIFYRFEKGLHGKPISVAVVVQKMIQSEVSGIAFSVHPVTQDYDQLIIEAGFGLGEAIVSGSVTPDSFVIEKSSWKIIDKNITTQERGLFRKDGGENEWRDIPTDKGEQPTLTDEEVIKLAQLVVKIEKHYGFPVDVEWAREKDKFYIVQSRPITTLAPQKEKGSNYFDGHVWNLAVTRNMSFWHEFLSNEGHFHHSKDFGIPAQLQWLVVTEHGTYTSCFLYQPNFGNYANAVMDAVASEEKIEVLKKRYEKMAQKLLVSLDTLTKKLNEENYESFTDIYKRFCAGLMLTATIGRVGGERLAEKLKAAGVANDAVAETIGIITYPKEHTPLFDSRLQLIEIAAKVQWKEVSEAEVEKELGTWLTRFGHIPVNFCEDPWTFADAKEQFDALLVNDCTKELQELKQSHKKRITNAAQTLQKLNNQEVGILAKAIAEGTYINEIRKNIFSRVSLEYRGVFSEVAKKAGSDQWRDCFYLTPDEMQDIIVGKIVDLPALVASRSIIGYYVDDNGLTKILDDEATSRFHDFIASPKSSGDGVDENTKIVKGHSANGGKVTGTVKIVLESKDFHKLNAGDILVTTMTSVDFVPVMQKAAAFITNEGGITSHASIVAREMNKPCIIGTKNASQLLKDGDEVEVNANEGVVKILKKASAIETNSSISFQSFTLKDFDPTQWHFYGLWTQDLFSSYFWVSWFNSKIFGELGIKIQETGTILLNGGNFFYRKSVIEDIRNQILRKIDSQDRSFFEKIATKAQEAYTIAIDFSAHSKELTVSLESFEEFLSYARLITFHWCFSAVHLAVVVERILSDKIVEYKIPPEKVPLLIPRIKTPLLDQKEELLQLKKEIKNCTLEEVLQDVILLQKLEDHRQRYAWIEIANWIGEELTIEKLFNLIANTPSEIHSETSDIDVPDDLAFTAWSMGQVGYVKQAGAEHLAIYAQRTRPFLESIASQLGLSYRQFLRLSHEEVKDGIAAIKGKTELKKIVESESRKRMNWMVLSGNGQPAMIDAPDDIAHLKKRMIPVVDTNASVIRGDIGNKGKATGKVSIIMNVDDFHKMNVGDVLVTTMTTPDYVILMQKAAAIVTDIGGMLCHAAIMSREIKRPCIIGTKIATQVLHDGDEVEVDADNGIVKIL